MSTLYYTESHEWLLDDEGTITIGITDHAQEQLGEVVYVELPEIGHEFEAGEELVVIESVKAAGGIQVPVGGQVLAVNEQLSDSPELVNEDPMAGAWMVKFQAAGALPVATLMSEEQYQNSLES